MLFPRLADGVKPGDVLARVKTEIEASRDRPRRPGQRRRMIVRNVSSWLDSVLIWPKTPLGRIAEAVDGWAARLLVHLLIAVVAEKLPGTREGRTEEDELRFARLDYDPDTAPREPEPEPDDGGEPDDDQPPSDETLTA